MKSSDIGRSRRCAAAALLGLGLGLAALLPAQAQGDFPSRTITIIVPYPAGGIADSISRIVAEHASKTLGQPIVVDAKPGANGNIGTQAVQRAPADGYTWLFAAPALTSNPSLYKGLWDPLKDFTGVSITVNAPTLIAVPASLGVKDLKDFVELAKRSPGKLNFGNPGSGTSMHLNTVMFTQAAGVQLTSIPYKGQPPVLQDMLRGDVSMSVFSVGVAAPQVTAGKLRPLAVISDHRLSAFPDVPTLAEAGFREANVVPWYGFAVAGATPRPVAQRINDALNKALESPEVQARLRTLGLEPQPPRSIEQIQAVLRSDFEKFRQVIQTAGITVD